MRTPTNRRRRPTSTKPRIIDKIQSQMIRIYADFNSKDERGRVRLSTAGSRKDIERHRASLKEGLEVILYMADDCEVRGALTYDGIWLGIPDWNTIRHYKTKE